MFGKPEWFRPKKIGWGLVPITWQGWVYTAIWSGVIVAPFLLLLMVERRPEAVGWMVASIGGLTWDVAKILKAMRGEPEDVFVIDENTDSSHLATRNYDMRLRD